MNNNKIAQSQCSWFLLSTKPRQEEIAWQNLARQEYQTYLPRIKSRRRRNGRMLPTTVPMFPGYMFVRLNLLSDNWSPIRSTLGVRGMVRFGNQPARIADEIIHELLARGDAHGVQAMPPSEHLRTGDQIRVVGGVLAGYEGSIFSSNSRERVAILLELAGKYTQVEIPNQYIERLR